MPVGLSREEILRRGARAREDAERQRLRLRNDPDNQWILHLLHTYQSQVEKFDRLLAELNAEQEAIIERDRVRPLNNQPRQNPIPLEEAFDMPDEELANIAPQNPGIDNNIFRVQMNANIDNWGFVNIEENIQHPIVDNDGEVDHRPRVFNDELIQEAINQTFKNYKIKSPKEVEKYEKTYKTILVNKRDIIHIECPKDSNDSEEVLYDKIQRGNDYKVHQVPYLPNNKKSLDKSKNIKQVKLGGPKKFNDIKTISNEEFWKLNDHLFTVESKSFVENPNVYNNVSFRSTRSLDNGGRCAANVFVCGTDPDFRFIRGFTTGKYNHDTGMCEIIGAQAFIRDFESREGASYVEKSKLQKYEIHNSAISVVDKLSRSNDYIRVKVNSYKDSANAFGNNASKKSMVGKLVYPNEFRIHKQFNSKRLGKIVDCVDILTESGTFIKFLMSDVSFMYVNPELVGLNKKSKHEDIKIEARVKIIDDRRITLRRGDKVVVKEITKNPSNMKNSRVKVLDSNNKIHFVLLKQLKLIENNVVKTEIKKPRISDPFEF